MSDALRQRLHESNPGWPEWNELIELVDSLPFEQIDDEYLGTFFASGRRLSFSVRKLESPIPEFVPSYVGSLYGLKPDEFEMAGGYAVGLSAQPAVRGKLFSPAGNDAALGYPEFDPPDGIFPFQMTSSGATIFLTKDLDVVVPDANEQAFVKLDALESFTRRVIRAAIENSNWTSYYQAELSNLLD